MTFDADQSQKDIEAAYFANIGSDGLSHSLRKPFADVTAGQLLMEMGAVMSLLPSPPARVVDLGGGTGWTTAFLARRGYEVLGLDLSNEAVAAALNAHREVKASFQVYDFDDPWGGSSNYDAVVFFDSLHHSSNEETALGNAYTMLRQGGICVTCEPGLGHAGSVASREAVALYGVQERDMPPSLITAAARSVGFRSTATYAHPHELHRHLLLPA